jgi:hypothetical protein
MAKYTSQKGTVASFVSSANSGDLYVINSDSKGARINSKVALTSADQIAIDGFSTDYRIVVNSKGVVTLTNLATKTSSVKTVTFTVANNADVKISFADGTLTLERDGAKGYNIGAAKVTSKSLRLESASVQDALNDALVYDPVSGNLTDASTYTLTNSIDKATANIFNSEPLYTPGGNDFINSLQDEDVLTGTGINPTLNVTLGSVNDAAEDNISPVLNGIETVNISVVDDEVEEVSFQNATGLKTLNVVRITEDGDDIYFKDLDKTVTTLSVNSAARATDINFYYRENVLDGTNDSVTLNINNTRSDKIYVNTDEDGGEDDGYNFEDITVNFTGRNDIDDLDFVGGHTREDKDAGRAVDTTKQNMTINANGASGVLEINDLNIDDVDSLTIVAAHRVDIADDTALPLSANNGLDSSDLETLTIRGAGNVRIDGVGGQVGAFEDTQGLTVNASSLTGNLRMGVESTTAGDDLFVLTSGTGNDEIQLFGQLGGDISTQAGNDKVTVGTTGSGGSSLDMLSTASIITGTGNDTVVAGNLLAEGDNVQLLRNNATTRAATIDTGDDNDTVTVGSLQSAVNWDDNVVIEDDNSDDRYSILGASVKTGSGNDILNINGLMAENTLIDMGANDDAVNYNVASSVTGAVLADDTVGDHVTVNPLTTTVETSDLDLDGAVIDLGTGNDTITFTDVDTAESVSTLLAGSATVSGAGAKLKGGLGTDKLVVNTTDNLIVASAATTLNSAALITGIETIELNISNAVDAATTTATGVLTTDTDDMANTAVTLDVKRVDSDLANLNLVSEERPLQTLAGSELYESGDDTTFNINNMRTSVGLSLTAQEATGVTTTAIPGVQATNAAPQQVGRLVDDTMLSINSVTGAVTTGPQFADVTLNLDYNGASGTSDSEVLNVAATSGAFDLNLNIAAGALDGSELENFTINFADSNSHSINAGGFGDATNAPPAPTLGNPLVSTSFIVNTAAGAGKRIDIDNVDADTIRVMNANSSAGTAANVTLRVSNSNEYTIQTGSGTDILDMRADNVQADDSTTANINETDTINLGTGRDTIIIDGVDNMGDNDLVNVSSVATEINDDVFANISGVEILMIDAGGNTSNDIVLDEAAAATGIDTIKIVDPDNSGSQGIRLVIGNNFAISPTAVNGELTTASSALVIDASLHSTGQTNILIENKDDDTDIATVNLDIRLNAAGGADLLLADRGTLGTRTEVRITALEAGAVTDIDNTDASDNTGEVDILVDSNENIDKIVMVDAADTNAVETALDVDVEADWTGTSFEFDASALLDTDGNAATGGMTFDIEAGDAATYNVSGTQNSDTINGSAQADTLTGNAGNDSITGMNGADSISGGAGSDVLIGEITPVNGNSVAATSRVLTFAIGDLNVGEQITFEIDGFTWTSGAFADDLDIDNDTDGPDSGDTDTDTDTDGVDGNLDSIVADFITAAVAAGKLTNGALYSYSNTPVGVADNLFGGVAGISTVVSGGGDDTGSFSITLTAGTDLDKLITVTNTTGNGGSFNRTVTSGSVGYSNVVLEVDTLNGGTSSDVFELTVGRANVAATEAVNMLTSGLFDSITDFNLNEDSLRLWEVNDAGTAVSEETITSVVNNGQVVNISTQAASLTSAINDMFTAGREFGSDETNVAALVNFNGRSYVVALGDIATGQFGVDDYIVEVTGYTGTQLTTSAFTSTAAVNLAGTVNADTLRGTIANDTIAGSDGNDTLYGNQGNDSLTGGIGNDVIFGDTGVDTMTGSAGQDRFVIANADSGITLASADTITDFVAIDDAISLGLAGDATAGTGNYVEAASALVNFAAALAAANVALTALNTTSSAGELYSFQFDGTNGYLFNDTNSDGVADQVVVLVGIDNTEISAADIVA